MAKKNSYEYYHVNKSFDHLTEEQLKSEFGELVSIQRKNKAVYMHTISKYCRSVSRNIYVNDMFDEVMHPYHSHDFFEINYVVEGRCYEYIGDKLYTLEAGDFLMMPAGVEHCFYSNKDTVAFNVIIRMEYINSMERELFSVSPQNFLTKILKSDSFIIFRSGEDYMLRSLFKWLYDIGYKVYDNYGLDVMTNEKVVKLMFSEIALRYSENAFEYESSSFAKKSAETDKDIMLYVSENIANISLESLANEFGYSTKGMCKKLMKITGKSYTDYVSQIRISKSVGLLLRTDYPIAKIAELVGFKSSEYFCRFFKKANGNTPSDYRKEFESHDQSSRYIIKEIHQKKTT